MELSTDALLLLMSAAVLPRRLQIFEVHDCLEGGSAPVEDGQVVDMLQSQTYLHEPV